MKSEKCQWCDDRATHKFELTHIPFVFTKACKAHKLITVQALMQHGYDPRLITVQLIPSTDFKNEKLRDGE